MSISLEIPKMCLPNFSEGIHESVVLNSGQCIGLIGSSGVGRSYLLKSLGGLASSPLPFELLIVRGKAYSRWNFRSANLNGFYYVPRHAALFSNLQLWQNLFISNDKYHKLEVSNTVLRTKAEEIFREIGLDRHIDCYPFELSNREQQLLGLARIFTEKRSILLLDESSVGLADEDIRRLNYLLEQKKQEGLSILYALPPLFHNYKICDRLIQFKSNEVVERLDLLEAQTESRRVQVLQLASPSIELPSKKHKSLSNESVLTVTDFKITAKSGTVLESLSFELKRNEILGVFGPAEGGRLNLLHGLFGARGSAESIEGSYQAESERKDLDSVLGLGADRFGLLSGFQKRFGLFLGQSPSFNLSICSLLNDTSFFWRLPEKENAIIEHYQRVLRLPEELQSLKSLKGLTRLELQKIVLGRWLATKPIALFLDEPFRGLKKAEQKEFSFLLRDVVDQGVSLVLASASIKEHLALSDRVLGINEGKLLKEMSSSEITEENLSQIL